MKILCLSAPTPGVINMVTGYFQALGKAVHPLTITELRNAVLIIQTVIFFNHLWRLNGVIAARPVVESLLMTVSLIFYAQESDAGYTPQKILPGTEYQAQMSLHVSPQAAAFAPLHAVSGK